MRLGPRVMQIANLDSDHSGMSGDRPERPLISRDSGHRNGVIVLYANDADGR